MGNHFLFDTSTGFSDLSIYPPVSYYPILASIVGSGKINECASWTYNSGAYAATNGPSPPSAYGVGIPWSIAFWIKSSGTSAGAFAQVLEYANVSIDVTNSSGTESLSVNYSPSQFAVIPVFGGFSSWRHICIIYDGYNNITFYLDGSLYSNLNYIPYIYGTTNNLGKSVSGVTLYLDDLRFYDYEIDSTEVSFIYNSGSGTQSNSGSGGGNASGNLDTIVVNSILGSASGSAGPGAALGSFPSVLMSAPTGNPNIGGIAFGLLSTVNVISFQGIAYPEFIAYGSLPTITVSAIQAVPVIGTTIQLDYVACDGEVTWTQNLPITGFSSAIQGQDAISSRITPTIGASGANIVFFEQRTLAASGNQTYDLKSLTDFLGGALSLDRAYAIILLPTSGSVSLSPGASNPFQWFFASSTANISLSSQNVFMFAQRESATITSGSKTLKVTNTSGAASATYKIAILGGR